MEQELSGTNKKRGFKLLQGQLQERDDAMKSLQVEAQGQVEQIAGMNKFAEEIISWDKKRDTEREELESALKV